MELDMLTAERAGAVRSLHEGITVLRCRIHACARVHMRRHGATHTTRSPRNRPRPSQPTQTRAAGQICAAARAMWKSFEWCWGCSIAACTAPARLLGGAALTSDAT